MQQQKYTIGSVYHSNTCGDFEIIERTGRECKIRFLNTGYETNITISTIAKGCIKDPYYPKILNIGCFGTLNLSREEYIREYNRWYNMLNRCYNPSCEKYPVYGAIGISVCDRWKCFEYYFNDIKFIEGYDKYLKDPHNYKLDKDIKQWNIPKGQRVYSPETCLWVPNRLNMYYAREDKHRNNKYYCVYPKGNNYRAMTKHYDMSNYVIGIYETEEIAAAAYNQFVSMYYPYMPLNDVPPITEKEAADLDLRKSKYNMCRIVNKK